MDVNLLYMVLFIAIISMLLRIMLAFIATKFRGWGWYPWIVIGCEIGLAIMIPSIEKIFGMVSFGILLFMAIKKKKPKEPIVQIEKDTSLSS